MKFKDFRENLAIAFFFTSFCSIPFWFSFLMETIIGMILNFFAINFNTKIIGLFFVIFYSFILLYMGCTLFKDKNFKNSLYPIMCIISGLMAIIIFIF